MVRIVNAGDQAKILINRGEESMEDWQVKEVPRSDYKEIFDVFFSYVGQCDPGDCDAQKEFFDVKESRGQQDAWAYKYLLDIDGNAFSGRFYAFLQSKSLVYKMAIFREWHEEWLKPWVHYIPLSLKGDEWVEAMRWFAGEAVGKKEAERLAVQGKKWSEKVLRNDDLEVWFFRLLLEYVPSTFALRVTANESDTDGSSTIIERRSVSLYRLCDLYNSRTIMLYTNNRRGVHSPHGNRLQGLGVCEQRCF
jgi:hypothetical protein